MKINFGFIISYLIHLLDRPSLRKCNFSNTSKTGYGVHCVNVSMGRYSYMGNRNVVVDAEIGSFCSIASYCSIGGGNHPSQMLSTSPLFYEGRNIFNKHMCKIPFSSSKPVIIGNDVWIGEKVFIKDGITIGDGAIVGAHSVVTRDVPPFAIVAGAPAKIIKYRFDSNTIDYLLETKWWHLNDKDLSIFVNSLGSKKVTIENISIAFDSIK